MKTEEPTKPRTVYFLRRIEFSAGNGQCPQCSGVAADWEGHPCTPEADNTGHLPKCDLAFALEEACETVHWAKKPSHDSEDWMYED